MLYIQSKDDFASNYRHNLAQTYNDTQGGTNEYLDKLHSRFLCCGTSGMQLNVTGDSNLFEPDNGKLTRLPRSCCPVRNDLSKCRCTSTNIYKTPCDVPYVEKVRAFYFFAMPTLVVALVWKIIFHFLYKRLDSFFDEVTDTEQIRELSVRYRSSF